jgi:hypothetical protein
VARPRVDDDGRTVTLDLHGAPVERAAELIVRACAVAARRGRATVRVVHGSSTSDPAMLNRTIRHALDDLLDSGALKAWVVESVRGESITLLGLPLGTPPDRRLISLADLQN